ncbi:MAG: GNAT family N-acetyltransferase [Paracoccaceae bacterium]
MDRRTALRTERLVLRPLTRDDIPDLVAGLDDYEVSKWLAVVPYPYRPEDAGEFLAHLEAAGGFDGYGITRERGPVMGVVGIGDSLGYWLGRAYHRHGYMTEAARALVDHYFTATGAEMLESGYFTGNAASAAVLGKLGFRPTHDETVASRARGTTVTIHRMRLTRADWAAGRAARAGG